MGEGTETEVKLRLESPDAAREALARVGATLVRPRHFEENVLFDDAAGSIRATGGVVRLRTSPHASVLTFKGARRLVEGMKTREERQTLVEEPAAVRIILERLGYRPVFRYQKYRESWTHHGQEIEIDETPIGTFLEIEGDPEGIRAVTAELGHEASEYLSESYVGLFFAQGGQGDMVFDPPPGDG
ncbi:MAG: class IV adenylate cyclase [Acidobacteria bacterium]|jgi:adenylate cyclase class 2|nr:class IV adenylate cyclase [Acidobacteriota bacterium]